MVHLCEWLTHSAEWATYQREWATYQREWATYLMGLAYDISDPTPTPPLQGRGVPAESISQNKMGREVPKQGRKVPAKPHATGKAVAAPLPCKGGAGVGLLFSPHQPREPTNCPNRHSDSPSRARTHI